MRKHYTTEQMRNKSTGALTDYYANEKTPVYVKDPLLENWQLLLPIPYNVIITVRTLRRIRDIQVCDRPFCRKFKNLK